MTNSVKCLYCKWIGNVEMEIDICPKCGRKKCLALWYNFKRARRKNDINKKEQSI
jgi:hypothetical protein